MTAYLLAVDASANSRREEEIDTASRDKKDPQARNNT